MIYEPPIFSCEILTLSLSFDPKLQVRVAIAELGIEAIAIAVHRQRSLIDARLRAHRKLRSHLGLRYLISDS